MVYPLRRMSYTPRPPSALLLRLLCHHPCNPLPHQSVPRAADKAAKLEAEKKAAADKAAKLEAEKKAAADKAAKLEAEKKAAADEAARLEAETHETHRWGYFLRTKPSNEDYFFERRKVLNCSNAFVVAVLLQTLR